MEKKTNTVIEKLQTPRYNSYKSGKFNYFLFRFFLQNLLFYFFLSIMLIACCGNLTPLAIDYAKIYKNVYTDKKPNVLALLIGLVSRLIS